jgi:hypothetical protein
MDADLVPSGDEVIEVTGRAANGPDFEPAR